MTNQEILNKLKEVKKGRYIKLIKVKDLGNSVIKESHMVIRLGVDYSKMSINENRVTGSLPWGVWEEGLENLVLSHKGNFYLRVSSKTPENPDGADVINTKYFLGDKEITKEEALTISPTKRSSSASPVYNIKFENIISLG